MHEVLDVRRCHNCGVVVAEVIPDESLKFDPWGISNTKMVFLSNADTPITKHKKNYWCKKCGSKDPDLKST